MKKQILNAILGKKTSRFHRSRVRNNKGIMDYPTVVRCFLELKRDGPFSEDICELLFEEFMQSDDLSVQESTRLKEALFKWQIGSQEDKSDQVILIEKILFEKIKFMLEYARFAAHRLSGGSIESF